MNLSTPNEEILKCQLFGEILNLIERPISKLVSKIIEDYSNKSWHDSRFTSPQQISLRFN